jgi:hypothetical protein
MIESFNGLFLYILFILNLLGGAYYAYQSVFITEKFLDNYGIHPSALLPARLAGSFVLSTVLMGAYILFRGPEGTWAYFVILFLQSVIFCVLGYLSVNHSEVAKMEGVKYTAEAYIAPAIFTLINGVLIYGLSDKIYS